MRVSDGELLTGAYAVTLAVEGPVTLLRVYLTGAHNRFGKGRCTCVEIDRDRCKKQIAEALKRAAAMMLAPEEY